MSDTPHEIWRRVEAEALAQVRSEIDQNTPIQPGTPVAWSLTRFGRTDGFSAVHRAGETIGDLATTLCGDLVPEPILRLALSPRLIRHLGSCKYCEAAMALRSFAA